MKFRYIGESGRTVAFGLPFEPGVAVEVTDPHAINKLARNQFFVQDVDGVQGAPEQPKRRGRPPKAK